MKTTVLVVLALLVASTASAELTTTSVPIDVTVPVLDTTVCEALAEASVSEKATFEDVKAICPMLSDDYILAMVFGYAP